MKITARQLKQLIREELERDRFLKEIDKQWDYWVNNPDNISDIEDALKSKYNVNKMNLTAALKLAKIAFYNSAELDPDFNGYYKSVEDLLPELKKYWNLKWEIKYFEKFYPTSKSY